jgi:hypothetical protein
MPREIIETDRNAASRAAQSILNGSICRYVGSCADPGYNRRGTAHLSSGYRDADSVEHGAWVFVPEDDSDSAYYVAESDLEIEA